MHLPEYCYISWNPGVHTITVKEQIVDVLFCFMAKILESWSPVKAEVHMYYSPKKKPVHLDLRKNCPHDFSFVAHKGFNDLSYFVFIYHRLVFQ